MIALTEHADLTKEDIIQLAKNSFEIAWISDEDKQVYLDEIDEYVASYQEA